MRQYKFLLPFPFKDKIDAQTNSSIEAGSSRSNMFELICSFSLSTKK